MALGANATTSRDYQIALGTTDNTYTLAGVTSSGSTDAQDGTLYMVTTDSSGNLATTDIPSSSSSTTFDYSGSGANSIALGTISTQADGEYATAIGGNSNASGVHSIALGINTTASGSAGIAIGADTIASGTFATAVGRSSTSAGMP